MPMSDYLFTSESVTEGHPDKMADQISDAVLDAVLAKDEKGRVACETLLKTGYVMIAGEIAGAGVEGPQDATGAICVQTDQTNQVDVGDEIEAVGFRAVEEGAGMLKNGQYRVLGKGLRPAVKLSRASEALDLANRGRLLQIDARLQEDVHPALAPELGPSRMDGTL